MEARQGVFSTVENSNGTGGYNDSPWCWNLNN